MVRASSSRSAALGSRPSRVLEAPAMAASGVRRSWDTADSRSLRKRSASTWTAASRASAGEAAALERHGCLAGERLDQVNLVRRKRSGRADRQHPERASAGRHRHVQGSGRGQRVGAVAGRLPMIEDPARDRQLGAWRGFPRRGSRPAARARLWACGPARRPRPRATRRPSEPSPRRWHAGRRHRPAPGRDRAAPRSAARAPGRRRPAGGSSTPVRPSPAPRRA